MKIILAVALFLSTTAAIAAQAPFPASSASPAANTPYQESAKSSGACTSGGCSIKFAKVKANTVLQHLSCGYVVSNAGDSPLAFLALSDGPAQFLLPMTSGKKDAEGNLDYVINAEVLLYQSKATTATVSAITVGGTSPGMECELSGYSN